MHKLYIFTYVGLLKVFVQIVVSNSGIKKGLLGS